MTVPGWVVVLGTVGSLQVLLVAWILRSWRSDLRRRHHDLRVRHRAALITMRRVIALADDGLGAPNDTTARALLERVQMVLAPWRPRLVRERVIPRESRKAAR